MEEQEKKNLIIDNLKDSLQNNPDAVFAITIKGNELPMLSCSGDKNLLIELISKCMAEEEIIASIIIDAVNKFPKHKLAYNERKKSEIN